MKFIFPLFLLLLPQLILASDAEKQIRNYIQKIEKTQKEIAQTLVLQNFSRLMVTTFSMDSSRYVDFMLSPSSAEGLSGLNEAFFDTIYSDSVDAEKINAITRILIRLRGAEREWIHCGSEIKSMQEDFFNRFKNLSEVCSEDSFFRSMAIIQNFSPSGIDAGRLRLAWDLQVGTTLSSNGDEGFQLGPYAGLQRPGENNNEASARHAVATTAGALAYLAPPPFNLIGAIALPIFIETIWGIADMEKNIKEMNQIADANKDLYKTMRFEINVKKEYLAQCSKLEKAFTEVRPAILEAFSKNDIKPLEELRKSYGFATFNQENIHELMENFESFSANKLLSDAITIMEEERNYTHHWTMVVDRINEFSKNIDLALTQIIANKAPTLARGKREMFVSILSRIEDLSAFKSAFTKDLLSFFDAKSQAEKEKTHQSMKWLLENYQLLNPELSSEETEIINTYSGVLRKLENN